MCVGQQKVSLRALAAGRAAVTAAAACNCLHVSGIFFQFLKAEAVVGHR